MISSLQRPLPENTQHSQKTSMPPVGFETTISADERPQTYALHSTATGTGILTVRMFNKEISAIMNPATSSLIKPKSCNALLHLLLLCVRGYLKAVLKYECLIWIPVIPTQYVYWREQRSKALSLKYKWQCGSCSLHAGWLRLQTRTQNI
jgi:hypothetical protein